MKDLINKVNRDLSFDEWQALMDVSKILEKAFKKKIFQMTINPVNNNDSDIYGLTISFDIFIS